jgi:hypothetical protein
VTKSGYINKELKYVLDVAAEKQEGSTFVIPVKLRECRIPETLRRWQWADLAHADGYERLVYALRVQAEVRGLFAEAVLHKEALLISSEAAAAPDESSNGEDLVFGATYAQTIRQLRRLMDKCDSPPIGNAEVPSWAADLPLEMDTLPVADNAMVLNAIVQWPLDAKDPNALDWSTWRTDAEFHSLEGLWSSRWRFSSTVRTAGWHEGTAMVRTKGDWVLIQYKDSTNLYFIRARRIGLSRLVGRYLNAEVIEDTTAWVGIVVDNRRIDGFWFSPHHGRWDLKR